MNSSNEGIKTARVVNIILIFVYKLLYIEPGLKIKIWQIIIETRARSLFLFLEIIICRHHNYLRQNRVVLTTFIIK